MTSPRELLDDEDEAEDSPDSDSEESESTEGDKAPKSSDKRVRDLQSEKDKETARANKAEKEVLRLKKALVEPDAESENESSDSPPADAYVLDMARMFAYQQTPKLAEYDIPASALTGNTPMEIAASATELVTRFEKIETRVRNKVLAENGQAPELDGGGPPPPARDFSAMSKEDFNKLVDETMGKRR
jgi:hypothetical protein